MAQRKRLVKTGSPWLATTELQTSPKLTLFCFPFSGSSAAAFQSWYDAFPSTIQVFGIQYPGRGSRFVDPLIPTIPQMVEAFLKDPVVIEYINKGPYALFGTNTVTPECNFVGHSLGAIVCFELAREIRKRNLPSPLHLCISSRNAPERPVKKIKSTLSKAEFVDTMKTYGGTAAEVFSSEQLLDTVIPIMRNDWGANEKYTYVADKPLTIPMSIMYGTQDQTEDVNEESMLPWKNYTEGTSTLKSFAGDHFYVTNATLIPDVTKFIFEELSKYL